MVDEAGDPPEDFSLSPWMLAGKPSAIKASADDLRTEVLHHTLLDDAFFKNPSCPKA